VFLARVTRGRTRRENYQCLSHLECEIKQYKSKDIILIVWTSIGTLDIYLQNGIVFMNDFLWIYSMSILTYLYVETTAYKFRIYSMITMNELAKWNHRTGCCCFVKLIYCYQDFWWQLLLVLSLTIELKIPIGIPIRIEKGQKNSYRKSYTNWNFL
jgi:hypothetical protein